MKQLLKRVMVLMMAFVLVYVGFAETSEQTEAGQNAIISEQDGKTFVLAVGQTKKVSVMIGNGKLAGKYVSFSNSNKKAAKISSSGKVTALKAGKTRITFYPKSYPWAKFSCTIVVKNASITLNKTTVSLEAGKSLQLKAKVFGKSSKVTWTSSNASVVKVIKGKLTAVKKGKATIMASANGKTVKCKVIVQ